MKGLAVRARRTYPNVLVANLYYDLLKFIYGCSAFAVDSPCGVLHARNLDWWTENSLLSKYTLVTWFDNGPAGSFATVGWPGFVGALSGIAPGRFAVTLNAVLSNEPLCVATPVTMLLRSVLQNARDFDSAVVALSSEKIIGDCLLLVSGTEKGQMVVVERTPTKSVIRKTQTDFIAVTNDYLLINPDTCGSMGQLQQTSCKRYGRLLECLQTRIPENKDECLSVLRDPMVRMSITVQHMVMSAGAGFVHVTLPEVAA